MVKEKTVVYAGSFEPFTFGHLSVVAKAARIFDRVVVLIAHNPAKQRRYPSGEMKRLIEAVLNSLKIYNCDVEILPPNKLVARYCESIDCNILIRGLRDTPDFFWEERLANINGNIIKTKDKIETIYIRADNSDISSSMVCELFSYGEDISGLVPECIQKYMEERRRYG